MEMDQVSDDGSYARLEALLVGSSSASLTKIIVLLETLKLSEHVSNYCAGSFCVGYPIRVKPCVLTNLFRFIRQSAVHYLRCSLATTLLTKSTFMIGLGQLVHRRTRPWPE